MRRVQLHAHQRPFSVALWWTFVNLRFGLNWWRNINLLTFAGFPIESAGGSGPFFAAIKLPLGGSPGEGLRCGEHHDVGGGSGPAGSPEGGAAGIGGFQHSRCGAAEREDDVRSFVLPLRFDTRLPLLILAQDRFPSLSFCLAYQPFSLLHLISSAQRETMEH